MLTAMGEQVPTLIRWQMWAQPPALVCNLFTLKFGPTNALKSGKHSVKADEFFMAYEEHHSPAAWHVHENPSRGGKLAFWRTFTLICISFIWIWNLIAHQRKVKVQLCFYSMSVCESLPVSKIFHESVDGFEWNLLRVITG